MPTPYGAKFVKCPFYRHHDSNRIVCEGLTKGNTLNLVYESHVDRAEYLKSVCCDLLASRDCPVHMMLMQKYEEDSNG
jgi:hypothetical protein